jgi:hypothetical protein
VTLSYKLIFVYVYTTYQMDTPPAESHQKPMDAYPLSQHDGIGPTYGREARRQRVETRAAAIDTQLARARRAGALGLPWAESAETRPIMTRIAHRLADYAREPRDSPEQLLRAVLDLLHTADAPPGRFSSGDGIWHELMWNELYELAYDIYGTTAKPSPAHYAMDAWDPRFVGPFIAGVDMDPIAALCCCYTLRLRGVDEMPTYAMVTPDTFRVLLRVPGWRYLVARVSLFAVMAPYLHVIRDLNRWDFMVDSECLQSHWTEAVSLFGVEYITGALMAVAERPANDYCVQHTRPATIAHLLDLIRPMPHHGFVPREPDTHLRRLDRAAREGDVQAFSTIAMDLVMLYPRQCRKALAILETHKLTDAVDEMPIYQHLIDTAARVIPQE